MSVLVFDGIGDQIGQYDFQVESIPNKWLLLLKDDFFFQVPTAFHILQTLKDLHGQPPEIDLFELDPGSVDPGEFRQVVDEGIQLEDGAIHQFQIGQGLDWQTFFLHDSDQAHQRIKRGL